MLNYFCFYRKKKAIVLTLLSSFLILSILWSNLVFSQEENRSGRRGRGESSERPTPPRQEVARPTPPRQEVARPETPRPERPERTNPIATPRPERSEGPERTNPIATPRPERSERPERTNTSPSMSRRDSGNDSGGAASLQQQLEDLNRRNRGDRDRNGGRESGTRSTSNAATEMAPLSGTLAGSQERGGRSERGRGGSTYSNSSRSSSGRDVVTYRPAPPPPPKPVVRPQVVVNIQTGFRGYGTYWTPDWYGRYGSYNYWQPPVVIAPAVWWRAPGWGVTWSWFYGYAPYYYRPAYHTHYVYVAPPPPVYYNYGDNIVYRGDMVYINGVPYVSADRYYEQGLELARQGEKTTVIQIQQPQTVETTVTTSADKPLDVPMPTLPIDPEKQSSDPSEQWMPLGTFALLQDEESGESDRIIQLAMNRGGILRGNLYDQKADKLLPIQGAVDQETQRVAFLVAGEDEKVYECGLWNLTQESLPLLVQEGRGRSETIKAVRLQENETDGNTK